MNAAVMVGALRFEASGRLLLLVAVAALALVYLIRQRQASSYAVRFTNLDLLDKVAPRRPRWRRHVPAVLLLLALAGMIGALAKPSAAKKVPRERATIIVAIDTSLSMEARDVQPTRIAAAKAAARDFIRGLPSRLNVGLVTFNGVAQVKVPPTTDRSELEAAIDGVRLGERTAIGEAIFASLDAIRTAPGNDPSGETKPPPARIVLMSDGSTTVGRPDAQAADAAKRAGVPISTIAFGTQDGTIRIEGEPNPVRVAVDVGALEKIANATGGKAFEATSGDELRSVYDNIGSSVGYTTEQRDVSDWFVAGSFALLLAAAVASQVWFSRLP